MLSLPLIPLHEFEHERFATSDKTMIVRDLPIEDTPDWSPGEHLVFGDSKCAFVVDVVDVHLYTVSKGRAWWCIDLQKRERIHVLV